jgi:hypothetical protein
MTSKEEIHTWFLNKIEKENFPIRNKSEFSELRKLCMQEFKLGRGHYGMINEIFLDTLKEKNIVVGDLDPSGVIGNLKIIVPKAEPRSEPSESILPPGEPQEVQPELEKIEDKPLPASVEESNKAVFRELFSFVGELYMEFGIVKIEDPPKLTTEKMTREEFNKKINDFSDRMGSFCFRHGVQAPFVIDAMSLVGRGFTIFGQPIVKTLFKPSEESKPEIL